MKLKNSTLFSHFRKICFALVLGMILTCLKSNGQTLPLSFDFSTTNVPAGLSYSAGATISTTGSVGSCTACTVGRLNVEISGFFQIDVPALSVCNLNMKSSGSSARILTVKYKHVGDPDYLTAGTVSVPQAGGTFELATLFPAISASSTTSVKLENGTGGMVHIHDVFVNGSVTLSTEAEILSFQIPSQLGSETINSTTGKVDIQVPSGTPLTSVTPTVVTLSAGATINPTATTAVDFSGGVEVPYVVTAQDGTTTKNWTVKVTEVLSSEKEITAFTLSPDQLGSSVINSAAGTISVIMPNTASLTNIVPQTLSISANATITPLATAALDFSSPVVYVVTAQNGTTKNWTIIVTLSNPPGSFTDYEAEEADFTGTVDNNHTGFTGTGFINFQDNGENYIVFNVCQTAAAAQTAKFRYAMGTTPDRPGKLFVNDIFIQTLNFPNTGAWTTWADETVVVSLQAGMNAIKITWDSTDGPNLDKLSLSGTPCTQYTLTINTTNSGVVTLSPVRFSNKYFDVETVTLLAEVLPNLAFDSWSGDLTGNTNPVQLAMTSNKSVTANFTIIPTYTLQVNTVGVGSVTLNPEGGIYPVGTNVTLTANTALGSTFQGWSGDATGSSTTSTVTMDANKTVTATFSSSASVNFEVPVGFASTNTGSTYPSFNGPVTGGQNATDTFWVNSPADFDALAWRLYYRNRAYNNQSGTNGVPKTPLVIVFKAGLYPEGTSSSSAWGNHMMTIQEQGDLTIIGQNNVTLNWGFNIKRSWNILIRNITFQDYYDDGVNIGEPETHHIWIDHCTLGHPTTLPSNTDHPDGGVDTKAGASYVSITWCLFRNSWKTSLVGHSDGNGAEDIGKLKVTFYANWFKGSNSRHPRVRFGEVHALNNLYEQIGLYGIAAAKDARVVAEGNFYLNTRWPMYADRNVTDFKAVYGNNTDNVFTSKTGNTPCVYLKQFNNDFDDSGLPVITAQINPAMLNPGGRSIKFDEFNAAAAFDPHSYYTYTAFTPSVVRTIVPLYAGADKINFFSTPVNTASIDVVASLNTFNQVVGNPSAVQTYTVSATNLTSDLTITPPANFEISSDAGATWHSSSSPIILTQTGGTIASTTISVRLNATGAGAFNGDITHVSAGSTPVNVTVNGLTTMPGAANLLQQWPFAVDATDDILTRSPGVTMSTATLNRFTLSALTSGYTAFSPTNGMAFSPGTAGDGSGWSSGVGGPGGSLSRVHYVEFKVTANAGYNIRIDSILFSNGFVGTTSGTKVGVDYSYTNFTADSSNVITTPGSFASPITITTQNVLLDQKLEVNGPGGITLTPGQEITFRFYFSCSSTGTPRWALLKDVKIIGEATAIPVNQQVVLQHWPFATDATDDPSVRSIGVTPSTSTLNRFTLSALTSGYTAFSSTNGMAFSPSVTGDGSGWGSAAGGPGGSLSRVHYVQFTVTAATGYDVKIDSLLLSNGFVGTTSGTRIGVDYSFTGFTADSNNVIAPGSFASPITITTQNVLLNQMLEVNGTSGTTISQGQTVTFRIYFSCSSTGTPRWALLKDLKVIGSISPAAGPVPTITTLGAMGDFVQIVGSPSAVQTYLVSGATLTGAITLTPPANYEISGDGGTTWHTNATPLILTPAGGTIDLTTITVRLNATSAGSHNGNIIHTSPGAASQNVPVSGMTFNPPVITVSGSLSGFSQTVGAPSAIQTYTVSANNLPDNLAITPPAGFEVSSNGGTTWVNSTGSLVLLPASRTIAATTITVRLNATSAGNYSGNITHASPNATTQIIPVNGTTVNPPSISTSGTITAFLQSLGTPTAAKTYTVSGSDLIGNIVITPPANFQISKDGTTWVGNASSITLTPVNGSVPSTTIQARLNASAIGSYSGNIVHTSTNAPTVNVAVSGQTIPVEAITVSSATTDFNQVVGTPSPAQTYTVTGVGLLSNITINMPQFYQVSTNGGQTWSNIATINRSGFNANASIQVRLNAPVPGTFTGNIAHNASVATASMPVKGFTSLGKQYIAYPVPAMLTIFITHPVNNEKAQLTIYNSSGHKVYSYEVQPGTVETRLDISNYPGGFYMAEYRFGEIKKIMKFIKQ